MSDEIADKDSILRTIKNLLGIPNDYTPFDLQIIMHINSVFTNLNQLGVGPDDFSITDDTATWSMLATDQKMIQNLQTYIYLKVRLIWDPPATSFTIESIQKMIAEAEFRLNISAENQPAGS